MIKLLIASGPLPENSVEIEYLIEETVKTYYNEVPKYTHKHGDYYERTIEKIPAYAWERWLQSGEQHERFEDDDDLIYIRYRREQGHLATFDTLEDLFNYLVTQGSIEFHSFKLLDGTSIYGITEYYD